MIVYILLVELLVHVATTTGEIVISDKIDFGSVENTKSSSSEGDSVVFTIGDSSQVKNPSRSFKQTANFRNDGTAFRERVYLKPMRGQSNCGSASDTSLLTVINKIRINMDDNESPITTKNDDKCENSVCDVVASTTRDVDGNLVTTLQLSIITRVNDIKVDDIPVIDGVYGTSLDDATTHHNYPHFIRNNGPQIYRYGPSHFQPSFGVPENNFFRSSATDPYHLYASARHGDGFQGQEHRRWLISKDGVDDKIDVPLSKTSS